MRSSAVGMFKDETVADSVTDALLAHGLPQNGIQLIANFNHLRVDGTRESSASEFTQVITRLLRSMGASESELNTYIAAVREGNVLLVATGTKVQADSAIEIMNAYGPIELQEFAASTPTEPNMRSNEVDSRGATSKAEQTRQSDGVRIFSW